MAKNPVMFVVEVGSVVTTLLLILPHGSTHFAFNLQITLWLWFTVLFANFAEAMAEGRGKAQADALRKAKSETTAYKLKANGEHRRGAELASARGRQGPRGGGRDDSR
jgi:K+-transporting ATPase ATPase B chain